MIWASAAARGSFSAQETPFLTPGSLSTAVVCLSFLASAIPVAPVHETAPLNLECPVREVGKYQKIEFTLGVPRQYTNSFDPDEVDLTLRVTTPSGQTFVVPAFWFQPYARDRVGGRDWLYPSGAARWQVRFAPQELGEHEVFALLKDSTGSSRSAALRFRCLPSQSKGFIRVSARDPRFLEFSEGQPFFAIGQNLAFIGSQQYVTLSRAERIFARLGENGANYLRIWACCEDWAMAIEARKSAFGRSWDWRPPLADVPGSDGTVRQCARITAERPLRIDPSHPVALRPSTEYLFSAEAHLQAAALRVELNGKEHAPVLQPGPERGWRTFSVRFETGSAPTWCSPVTLRLVSVGEGASASPAWVRRISLREAVGGPELLWEADPERPVRGYYNPVDSFMLDELVVAAERHGIYLQLCYLTRDHYMRALEAPGSEEYARAAGSARKALRYAVARWGYSTSVAAWEYWNEMDPGLPTDAFYDEVGKYLEKTDLYRHLRTTSTWGPSAKDCRHPGIDIADVHFYLRPSDKDRLADEVDAVLSRTRWLREQAPAKPAHLGEFGIANEKWQPTEEMNRSREIVDFHNALWASALSGASGTALFWWWDRLDPRDAYSHYRGLSRFVADLPWTSGNVKSVEGVTCSEGRIRPVGLQTGDGAWVWLFDRLSAWQRSVVEARPPTAVTNATLQVRGLPAGTYRVRWYDTRLGSMVGQQTILLENSMLDIPVPEFVRDVACAIRRQN